MIDLFVDPSEEIVVNFVVAKTVDGKIYADVDKKNLENILSKNKIECTIEEHQAIFRKPSFGDTVKLNESLYKADAAGQISINPLADRYYKIINLIKSWTLKDKDGNKIKPTEKNISNLCPAVGDIISIQLDSKIGSLI